jgi:hypothetical protein
MDYELTDKEQGLRNLIDALSIKASRGQSLSGFSRKRVVVMKDGSTVGVRVYDLLSGDKTFITWDQKHHERLRREKMVKQIADAEGLVNDYDLRKECQFERSSLVNVVKRGRKLFVFNDHNFLQGVVSVG